MSEVGFRVYVERNWSANGADLIFYRDDPISHASQYLGNFEVKDREHGGRIPYSDRVTIGTKELQELMDNLWQVGIRPTEGTGSAGSLLATQEHLKDLRDYGNRLLVLVENTMKT